MWSIILHINGVLLSIAGIYLIYSIGTGIITWSGGKEVVIALVLFIFFGLAEVALAAIAEP